MSGRFDVVPQEALQTPSWAVSQQPRDAGGREIAACKLVPGAVPTAEVVAAAPVKTGNKKQ
jgi:hypothetical protein